LSGLGMRSGRALVRLDGESATAGKRKRRESELYGTIFGSARKERFRGGCIFLSCVPVMHGWAII
jgi:hypothetical protein